MNDINIDPPNEEILKPQGTPMPPEFCSICNKVVEAHHYLDGVIIHETDDVPEGQMYMLNENQLKEQPKQEDTRPREGAPNGNDNALKFKTSEERQAFCDAYCEHIRKGYSEASFNYMGSTLKTLKYYREKFPVDFPSDKIAQAEAERMKFWETIGIQGTVGKLAGFNAMSWKFNMQNRFKWKDRTDQTSDDEKIDNKTVVYLPTKLPTQKGGSNEQE